MSLPREVLPGEFYMLCRACTQRMFLLRPGPKMNRMFKYCLAEAARRFGMRTARAKVLLINALDRWTGEMDHARRTVDAADLAAAQAGLI